MNFCHTWKRKEDAFRPTTNILPSEPSLSVDHVNSNLFRVPLPRTEIPVTYVFTSPGYSSPNLLTSLPHRYFRGLYTTSKFDSVSMKTYNSAQTLQISCDCSVARLTPSLDGEQDQRERTASSHPHPNPDQRGLL